MTERASQLPAAPPLPTEAGAAAAFCRRDPSRENAFGALRRARQTRIYKIIFPLMMRKANAPRIQNRLFVSQNHAVFDFPISKS